MMNNIMAALAQRICNSLTLATGMIFFALAAQSSKCQAQEDDYEFVPPQGWAGLSEIGDDDVSMMPAEGFEGLHDEPAKAVMIEAVDADGGLANVAPQLSVEEGPGGLDWDPSPTYRTRYKNGTNYVAGGGSRVQGNNWFMKIPYIIPVSANEYRLRCGANQFRVYTGSSPTWTGRYGNMNSVLKLSGSDILLYDTRGKEYLFSSSASLRCTRISGLGSERIEISYSSNSITVLLKPNAGAGTEVKQIVYTIGANNLLDRIDFNEKESGVWRLYRRVDFIYHEDVIAPVESSAGDLVGIQELVRLSSADGCSSPAKYDPAQCPEGWSSRLWAYRYYTGTYNSTTNPGNPYQVKAVLEPQSAKDALGGQSIPWLFTQTAQDLSANVDRLYTYTADRRIWTLELKESCGCGANDGVYTYSWITKSPAPTDLNTWSTYCELILPSANGSLHAIDYNLFGQKLNYVVYENALDPLNSRKWIRHWRHDTEGKLTDSYSPKRCSTYNSTTHAVTVSTATGSTERGLHTKYSYNTSDRYLETTKVWSPQDGQDKWIRRTVFSRSSLSDRRRFLKTAETAYKTEHQTEASANPVTTSFEYTQHTGTLSIKSRRIKYPVVAASENGSNGTINTLAAFTADGLQDWSRDGDGHIHYRGYDANRRTVVKIVQAINTASLPSGVPAPPSPDTGLPAPSDPGFVTPSGAGLNLVTDFEYDAARRITKQTSSAFSAWNGSTVSSVSTSQRWFYSRLFGGELVTLSYPHVDTQVYDAAISLNVTDLEGRTISSARGDLSAAYRPLGLEDDFVANSATLFAGFHGTILEQTDYVYTGGRLTEERVRTTPSNPSTTLVTTHHYDNAGRKDKTTNAAGTITRYSFDVLGRTKTVRVGTIDDGNPGANLFTVEARWYDDEEDNAANTGDGNLTQVTRYPQSGSYSRDTKYFYDYRQRLVQTDEPGNVRRTTIYDNRGLVTESYTYDISSGSVLMEKNTALFDTWGRPYETRVFGVTGGTAAGDYANSKTWRNARGMTIKTQSQGKVLNKTIYDGAGRVVTSALCYDLGAGEAQYTAADDLDLDTVIEERRYAYDATGAVELERFYQRRHNGSGTGPLTVGTAGNARAQYMATWYDLLHRHTHQVGYGTNGGVDLAARPTGNPPSSGSTQLTTKTKYTTRSQVEEVTDPQGFVTHFFYDSVGRVLQMVENYDTVDANDAGGQAVPGPNSDQDRTTEYFYDSAGRLSEVSAVESASDNGSPPTFYNSTTQYQYGVSSSDSPGPSIFASNDLVRKIVYPNPDPGAGTIGDPIDTPAERELFAYNALGETIWRQDQIGIVHEFNHDFRGRMTEDRVTTATPLPGAVDGTILRISGTYDALDRKILLTSWDNPTVGSGTKKNEMKLDYGKYSTVTSSWQEWTTGGVTGTSPRVQYAYTFPSAGETGVRLTSTTYPGGRQIAEDYTGTTNSTLNRIAGRMESGSYLFQDAYLGVGRLVERTYSTTTPKHWTLVGTDSANQDNCLGLDRFGRIDELMVKEVSTGIFTNRYLYTYNQNSQITVRQDTVGQVAGAYEFSETFGYDGLGRLSTHDRGVLGGTVKWRECWGLDRRGNPSTYYGGSGANCNTPTVTSEFNASDEISKRNGDATFASYSNSGDMTRRGAAQANNVYDAWGRAVSVGSSGSTLMSCEYAACGQLIKQSSSPGLTDRFYYYSGSQVVEERAVSGGTTLNSYCWGTQGVDDLVQMKEGAQSRFFAQDANGNITTQMDSAGSVTWRQIYDAYGNPKRVSFNWSTFLSISSDDYGFTGRQWHFNAGRYDYRSRGYDPGIERFVSNDAAGKWAASDNFGNAALYVENDPANSVDPSGHYPTSPINDLVARFLAERGISTYRLDISTGKRILVCAGKGTSVAGTGSTGQASVNAADEPEIPFCGILIKRNVEFQGHEWISGPGFAFGFWPDHNDKVVPTTPRTRCSPGGQTGGLVKGLPHNASERYEGEDTQRWEWPAVQRTRALGLFSVNMRDGPGRNKPCSQVTCADVYACIVDKAFYWDANKRWGASLENWNNCRHFTDDVLESCCLKKGKLKRTGTKALLRESSFDAPKK